MKPYNFEEAYEMFLSICEDYGIQVTDGTGQFICDGKPLDISCPFGNRELHEGGSHSMEAEEREVQHKSLRG